jgi:hypothetical protein
MRVLAATTALSLTLLAAPLASAQVPPPAEPPAVKAPGAGQQWYKLQTDHIRASKLIGISVTNDAKETIGSINEVVLGRDGKVVAVVIGVGGFLGIGEREVGINYGALRLSHDSSGKLIATFNVSKDALKGAPAWTWGSERSGTMPGPAYRATGPDKQRN